jgi:hypothetical protein
MRSSIRGVVAAGVLAAVLGVAPAYAESTSPWWGVTSSGRPTNLHSGMARDEVQEITVAATEGEVTAVEPVSLEAYEKGEGSPDYTLFKYDATHQEVQEALETVYGTGNVEVTGGPGDSTGTKPYVLTFTGELAGRPLGLMVTDINLGGLEGQATVTQRTLGKADGQIVVMVENLGDGDVNGASEPVQIADTLPAGLKAVAAEGLAGSGLEEGKEGPVDCPAIPAAESPVRCTFAGVLHPYETAEIRISVVVEPGASSGEQNRVSVSGGGAAMPKTISRPIEVGGEPRFGVQENLFVPEEVGGTVDMQAGSHPFQLTSVLTFNQSGEAEPVDLPKDVSVLAPSGLVGNPTPFAECTDQQFSTYIGEQGNLCPTAAAIGVATVTYDEPATTGIETSVTPIFNMVPNVGEPARFGFYATLVPVLLNTSVRTGGDYGVTVSSHNIIQAAGLLSVKITLWGVPGDRRHDNQRGYACLAQMGSCAADSEASEPESAPPPFLSLPTSCTGPLQAGALVDSWEQPGESLAVGLSEPMASLDGCNHLPFAPEISVAPDVPDASTPTGLTVDVHVPQTAALNPEGLAESSVKGLSVTLPAGVGLNPSGAEGLQSCPLLTGRTAAQEAQEANHELTGIDVESGQPANCPNASKIATVKVKTPLLPNALKGFVYLATPAPNGEPGLNPFNSLLALYFVAEDPVSGTLIKLPLKVTANPVTGQLTATQAVPELPFEDAELHFFGGEHSPLATPARCGSYTTSASFEPWSGNESVNPFSTFNVELGPNGSACSGQSLAFAPTLTGGTTNINAASFSPLTTTITREDGQQNISSVQLHMPPGLSGILSHVGLCGEAQANAGTCGAESLIGETIVSVGVGNDPYSVTGGKVYITGPYHGAPFGLSIVNPAVAGPFNLGQVIVRAKIDVDPHTAQLTITTNSESEGFAIPHIIDGIPLQIKHVNVTINRPGFTFNPTDCDPQQITGKVGSDEGLSSTVAVPFQVTNCASLKFTPKFAVSTSGKTSKADGASLSVKLTYPNTPQGTEANIAKVKVDLPKQLPSRLTTLQKACLAATFEANPANCPAASVVGHAKAITPILPVPLEGPAYFVSHGGEAFPSLIVVLQGYGVTVDLVGTTFISKAGITSSTFKAVPDVPVASFELTLPEGKYSALAANGNLCTSKLAMPTAFLAQNGAEIHESTPIAVTGCAKAKPLTREQKLTKALKACKEKAKGKRAKCQKQARKKYGPIKKEAKAKK